MTQSEIEYINNVFESDYTYKEFIEEIDTLKDREIQYLLVSRDLLQDNSNRSIFISIYLIPNFYNQSEYRSENYRIFYAPFFD